MNSTLLIGGGEVTQLSGLRGTTPDVPEAKHKRGDVVRVRKTKALAAFPREAVVLSVIPAGFPVNWALSDLVGEPRSAMGEHPVGRPAIRYILGREKDPKPYLARDRDLIATGEKVEIGDVAMANDCA